MKQVNNGILRVHELEADRSLSLSDRAIFSMSERCIVFMLIGNAVMLRAMWIFFGQAKQTNRFLTDYHEYVCAVRK